MKRLRTMKRLWTPFGYLLMAPFVFVALGSFALYFYPRSLGYFQSGPLRILWGATAGLLTFVTNVLFNVLIASVIWLELPTFRDDEGKFSAMTTTRLKALRQRGDRLADYLAKTINLYDPGHFS